MTSAPPPTSAPDHPSPRECAEPAHEPSGAFVPDRRPNSRPCLWCRRTIALHRGPGRQRLYCRHSCRQRAYERRRGLGVLPPPERLITRAGGPLAHLRGRYHLYEAGGAAFIPGRKLHALRPGGIAEAGDRRATLCGVMRAPNGKPFVPGDHDGVCETCTAIARARPAARPMRPSSDLAAYRAQLDSVAVRLNRAPGGAASAPAELAAALLAELLAAA